MRELPEWALFGRFLSIGFAVAIYVMLWWYAISNLKQPKPKDFPVLWLALHISAVVIGIVYWIVESWCWG